MDRGEGRRGEWEEKKNFSLEIIRVDSITSTQNLSTVLI